MSGKNGLYNLYDLSQGMKRELAQGFNTRIFASEQAMLSVLRIEPNAEGKLHSHAEEQWGVLLEGSGTRIQDGQEMPVSAGDFWCIPGNEVHSFRAGADGAFLLDIFTPPRTVYLSEGSGFGTND